MRLHLKLSAFSQLDYLFCSFALHANPLKTDGVQACNASQLMSPAHKYLADLLTAVTRSQHLASFNNRFYCVTVAHRVCLSSAAGMRWQENKLLRSSK